ncbi:hypothetical protein F4809DRAFT_95071 [Biscogniauxia mediterranea]|nr:hypothetical protein F4809DRAFT_95071 [Biscogniauxia mediterranea]
MRRFKCLRQCSSARGCVYLPTYLSICLFSFPLSFADLKSATPHGSCGSRPRLHIPIYSVCLEGKRGWSQADSPIPPLLDKIGREPSNKVRKGGQVGQEGGRIHTTTWSCGTCEVHLVQCFRMWTGAFSIAGD